MITPEQLEMALRRFDFLGDVTVEWNKGEQLALDPKLATLSGVVHIHGTPKYYEVELNLKFFEDKEDILMLVQNLMHSFEQCARSEEAQRVLH